MTDQSPKIDLQLHYRRLLFAYFALVPLAMFPYNYSFNFVLTKFIFLAVLAGYYCIFILSRTRLGLPRTTEDKWLLAYTLSLLVTTVLARDILLAIMGADYRRDGLISFFFCLVAYLVGKNTRLSKKILWSFLVSSLVLSLYGIIQFYKLDPISLGWFLPEKWIGRAFSTLGNPNFFGSYLVLVLPISLYMTLEEKNILGLVIFAVQLFALFCSRTRGAWLGAMVGLIVFIFLFFKGARREKIKSLGLLLLVVAIIITGIYLFDLWNDGLMASRVGRVVEDIKLIVGRDQAARFAGNDRLYIWQRVLELIKDRPLQGYGLENLGPVMEANYRAQIENDFGHFINFDKAHNEYLHIAVTSGIPSLLLYLGFIFSVIRKGYQKYKSGCRLMLMFLASLIGYLAQAFFNIQTILVYYIFMAMLGLLSSNIACPDQAESSPNSSCD